jgi:hypothetical protein
MTHLCCNGMKNKETFITRNVIVASLFYLTDNVKKILDQEVSSRTYAFSCGHSDVRLPLPTSV